MGKIDELRDSTYNEAKKLLREYHKCIIIRPTGFGKTGILVRLMKDYKNILYLYPSKVIKNTVLNFYNDTTNQLNTENIPNVRCWTYKMLTMATDEDLRALKDVDIIMCDECHRIGGKQTSAALHKLLDTYCKKSDLCGATATPERMDLFDEMTEFFDNHAVSKYTIHDMFKDGVCKRPYYCYCAMDYKYDFDKIRNMTNEEIEKMNSIEDRKIQKHKLNKHMKEISELVRMPNIIRETCDECIEDTNYMKFIIFCANISHINSCFDEIKRWFSKAYPNHHINTLVVSSETEATKLNVCELENLQCRDATIDLIYSCDMLNMGYHIDDLSGIIMYRTTNSNIIYTQQFGRVINSGSNRHGLIFDIVDNIHRNSLYDMMGELKTHGNGKDGYESVSYERIMPSDLIVTKFSASYKEMLEKIIAEPISMRCRQAYECWVRSGGKTTGEYSGIKGILLQEKAAREINYGYANDLKSDYVPITPFAKIKHVSIECIFETIFGKNQVKEYEDAIQEIMLNKSQTKI